MPFHLELIIFAVVAALCICAVLIFNRLVRGRNEVHEAWSGIDVQLRRRADLIPNLVATVRGYAAHERGIFEDVAARRASMMAAGDLKAKATADRALQGSLGRLFAVAEAYPELKANQNFLELQGQLAEVEDQLQMARRYYNGTVRDFNIGIQSFPDVLIAHVLGCREEHFCETDAASAAVPGVSLSGA
jgi:LemA protein